jgi:hypothetical protein
VGADRLSGIAESDPRNRGPIAFFAPKPVTPERMREAIQHARPSASPEEIETRVRAVMARIEAGPVRPPPPISQSLSEVKDPVNGLGTHPDIIEHMWKLDATLPRSCRWVFWGGPALVHPDTGVVFAVGFGTIGYVMRLPPHILAIATEDHAKIVVRGNPGQTFDIGPAGPEWRFVRWPPHEAEWCRAAFDFVGLPP